MNTYYAHSRPGAPIKEWQTLQTHCKDCVMSITLPFRMSYGYKIHPLFKSSLSMKYIIAISQIVCYNTHCHDTDKALFRGHIKSCELKHGQG